MASFPMMRFETRRSSAFPFLLAICLEKRRGFDLSDHGFSPARSMIMALALGPEAPIRISGVESGFDESRYTYFPSKICEWSASHFPVHVRPEEES